MRAGCSACLLLPLGEGRSRKTMRDWREGSVQGNPVSRTNKNFTKIKFMLRLKDLILLDII